MAIFQDHSANSQNSGSSQVRIPYRVLLPGMLLLLLLSGCTKHFSSTRYGNLPPKTYVAAFPYRDSTQASEFNPQSSRLEVKWWATDGDGLVTGYIITFDMKTWTYTTTNDSVFALSLFSKDTNYVFSVAAIDNGFKGKLNEGDTVAFVDKNGNGRWDKGEAFTELGDAVDPDPPSVKFPIANTPPTVSFFMNSGEFSTRSDIPETTFTVASFGWQGNDIDGNSTITSYYIALNDTSSPKDWVKLPARYSFITIEARLSEATNDTSSVSCDIYPNIYPALSKSPYTSTLPNLRLNRDNILYIRAEDVAGAIGPTARMPDTTHGWFVKKPKGDLLIVDDYGTRDNTTSFYTDIFDTLAGGVFHGKYDLWDIKSGSHYPQRGTLVQPYIIPTFQETLKLFKYVYWYADDDGDFDMAQLAVGSFRNNGGKIFMTFSLPSTYVSVTDINQAVRDFSGAIDSLTGTFLAGPTLTSSITSKGFVQPDVMLQPVPPFDSTAYPILVRDSYLSNKSDGGHAVQYLRGFYPSTGAAAVYKVQPFGVDSVQSVIGVMSGDKSAFILGVPLYRFNGNSTTAPNTRAGQLIYRIFKDFGAF